MKISSRINEYLKEHFDSDITEFSPVGGGCINDARRVTLRNGRRFFIKQNRHALLDMFEKEAKGLQLLAGATDEIAVPEVHGVVEDNTSGEAFLILSFVEESSPSGSFHESFGRALARMHQNTAPKYGLDHDNYIGKLPQKNDWREDPIAFIVDCRLEPQLTLAYDNGFFSGRIGPSFDRLCHRLPELLPKEPPSFLHGDLWGGNYLCNSENRPVLIDPAVYYGHREAELSFTRMFGGFDSDFYKSYEDVWPLEPGFSKRREIYNLYPLLVHVNLFGGFYVSQAESFLLRF